MLDEILVLEPYHFVLERGIIIRGLGESRNFKYVQGKNFLLDCISS